MLIFTASELRLLLEALRALPSSLESVRLEERLLSEEAGTDLREFQRRHDLVCVLAHLIPSRRC